MKKTMKRFLALPLMSALLLASCGITPPTPTATAIHLKRFEGTVTVTDKAGKEVEPQDDLALYSGYGLKTKGESSAWISLDDTKRIKLDEKSEIEITKQDKSQEIEVKSGSLFFHVTLADGETMTIRASSMAADIQDTCGWVKLSEDEENLSVYLLEGQAECSNKKETAAISAGEKGEVTPKGEIEVIPFTAQDIPDFVIDELDKNLLEGFQSVPDHGLSSGALAALGSIAYYGDPARCAMTPEQAAAFAQVIQANIDELEAMRANVGSNWVVNGIDVPQDIPSVYTAALFDLGDGTPALIFAGGTMNRRTDNTYSWWPHGKCGIWLYQDGAAVQYASGAGRQALFDGYLLTGGMREVNEGPVYQMYPISNGTIAGQPSATADVGSHVVNSTIVYTYLIDDNEVSFDDFRDWIDRWVGAEYDAASNDWTGDKSLAGFSNGTDVGCSGWGLSPAEDVMTVLEFFAGADASPALW